MMPASAEGRNGIVVPLREAALTAVIAAALLLPMVGIFTASRGGALGSIDIQDSNFP